MELSKTLRRLALWLFLVPEPKKISLPSDRFSLPDIIGKIQQLRLEGRFAELDHFICYMEHLYSEDQAIMWTIGHMTSGCKNELPMWKEQQRMFKKKWPRDNDGWVSL